MSLQLNNFDIISDLSTAAAQLKVVGTGVLLVISPGTSQSFVARLSASTCPRGQGVVDKDEEIVSKTSGKLSIGQPLTLVKDLPFFS